MALAPVTRLGPYEILAPLGAGGMGEVYRARDTRLGREVAVKVLPDDVASDNRALARFESEARAVAALSHPNILDLHDVGKEGDVSFVVMELLQGETLRELLVPGPLPLRTALDFGQQIAAGLAAAHDKGIVHRDLKPENLFVTSEGQIKILDFGLAKKLGRANRDDVTSAPNISKQTEPGVIVGTVGYMSPEQVKGLAVDHRSDIFSLGAVLYEMLSGRRAFRRDSAAETMAAILRDEPPDFSESERHIASALDRVVRRCLEKNVEQRFQSVRDVLFALSAVSGPAAFDAGQVVTPPPRSKRSFLVAVASGLVILLIVAGDVFIRRRSPVPPRPATAPSIAVLPFTNLSGDKEQEYFSDGLSEELMGLLTKVKGLHVAGRTSSFAFRGKNAKITDIARDLHVATVLEGSVRRSGDRLRVSTQLVNVTDGYQIWAERYDRNVTDVFAVQDEIAAAVVAALKIQLLPHEIPRSSERRTANAEAYRQYLLGRYFFARGNLANARSSVESYQKAIALDPRFAAAYAGLAISEAWAADNFSESATALEWARQRALAAATTALSLDPNLAEGYTARGYLRSTATWDWVGAQADLERALSIDPGDAETHTQYSTILARLGRLQDAIKEATTATDLDPLSADAWITLGSELRFAHQFADARRALSRAVEIVPDSHRAHTYLGSLSILEGHPADALPEFARSEVREGARLLGVALAQHDLGHPEESQQALNTLIAKYAHVWAFQVAEVYAWRGETDEAFRWLDRAYAYRDGGLTELKIDPYLAKLRNDKRYTILLKQVGLPPT